MRNWIVIALILLVIGGIGTGATIGKAGTFNFGTVEIDQHQEVDGLGAKNVNISLGSMNVTVIKGATNEVKASLTGKVSKKFVAETKLNVNRNGDTVTVSVDRKRGFTLGINIFATKLQLELPEQQYDSFVVNIGSGDTSITDLAAGKLEVKAGSGNVNLNQLTVNNLSLDLGSGNSNITDITANTAQLKAGSGNVKVDKLKAQKLSIKAGSGNIKLYGVDAELVAKLSSGNIVAEMNEINYPMDLSAGSGNVTINTSNKPASVQFKVHTGSGTVRNGWDGASESIDDKHRTNLVFGDDRILVKVDTGSGNVTLGKR